MFTREDFVEVANRINRYIHQTQMIHSRTLSEMAGNNLFLKGECFQKTGSFKIRGAASKVTSLQGKDIKGMVTASSGNHGQAVAYMASIFNINAVIVVPNNVSAAKLKAIKAYGAEIVLAGSKSEERLEVALKISREKGYLFVPPYDDYDIIKGQGTIGLEILQWNNEIDKIFVPIGGGGLISGIASCVKAINPKIKIIGVEPAGSCCMYKSLQEGRRVEILPETIADGLRTVKPGALTFPLIKEYVDHIILVEEWEIKQAMNLAMERMKVIIEPSGAVSFAAALREKGNNLNLVSVISGGNIDIKKISQLLA